jgi:phosphoglucosamine mutase
MGDRPRLFGTDGVRGVAGDYPLDRGTVWKLGWTLGQVLKKTGAPRPARIVLGEDTRESSAWISRLVAAGLRSSGVAVTYAGVITTPGVAFLTRHRRLAAGVMVSASHNPYQDNGIKVLSAEGTKLPESLELEVERALVEFSGPTPGAPEPALEADPQLLEDYLAHLEALAPNGRDLSTYRLVVDCAHGAASRVAPALLRRLGLRTRILNREPDGRNINRACGSLHPESMAEHAKASGADLGVAFDGDADRAIFATREGRIADGDHVLYALGPYFYRRDRLQGRAVVGTEMSNLGLELGLAQFGLGLKRTPVGDKYVLEEMLRSGINLGGEPSGHIIFSDLSLTGDGILTFLQVLRLLQETDEPLGHWVRGLKPFPQIIRNVRVRERRPFEAMPEVARTIMESRRELAARGRVVVRYSGTELLARVMVEAEEAEVVERHAARIAAAIDSSVGSGKTA